MREGPHFLELLQGMSCKLRFPVAKDLRLKMLYLVASWDDYYQLNVAEENLRKLIFNWYK